MPAPSPYRTLPADQRLRLVTHDLTANRQSREGYIQRMVARGGGFRRETLRKWPPAQLAREVVRANLETPYDEVGLLQLLYVELEPAIQVAFLDATGVKHEGGVVDEQLKPPFAEPATIRKAAEDLLATFGLDGHRYLAAIALYNGEAWPSLDDFLGTLTPSHK